MCEEVQRFEDLLMQQRELFAEEEIRASFPKLITFVLAVRSAVLSAFCSEILCEILRESAGLVFLQGVFAYLINIFGFYYAQTEKLMNDAAATGSGAVSLDENEVESLVSHC